MAWLRHHLGWTRHSYYLLSAFVLICLLIVYIWWPLVVEYYSGADGSLPWYDYLDWLLVGIFLFMSLTIMARADLRVDGWTVLIGMCGGLVIESWGTQTNLWHYYTAERPPLWIIPAWPIASLCINRITSALDWATRQVEQQLGWRRDPEQNRRFFSSLYWLTFTGFYALMLYFVAPTLDKSATLGSLLLCAILILTPPDKRIAWLVFVAGAGLGYYLELWGTTRECWMYYTGQTPPLFAVLAHGMAAVAFWRTGLLAPRLWKLTSTVLKRAYR